METITVCNMCGSRACLEAGGAVCSYDGAPRDSAEIPAVKYERSEGAAPKPMAMPGRRGARKA